MDLTQSTRDLIVIIMRNYGELIVSVMFIVAIIALFGGLVVKSIHEEHVNASVVDSELDEDITGEWMQSVVLLLWLIKAIYIGVCALLIKYSLFQLTVIFGAYLCHTIVILMCIKKTTMLRFDLAFFGLIPLAWVSFGGSSARTVSNFLAEFDFTSYGGLAVIAAVSFLAIVPMAWVKHRFTN